MGWWACWVSGTWWVGNHLGWGVGAGMEARQRGIKVREMVLGRVPSAEGVEMLRGIRVVVRCP